MTTISRRAFQRRAKQALEDETVQKALALLQDRLSRGAAAAYRDLPEGPRLRHQAHEKRMRALGELDGLLTLLAERFRANGGQVHFAADASSAVARCLAIARRHGVRLVVKGKSMVTEEIGLNAALQAGGIEVVETDLGEFIVQLAGESPSHIMAPAAHKDRAGIGRLLSRRLGIAYSDDAPTLTRAARRALRSKFLHADMGITGCNLACAQTGHLTMVSNEGNIRMATTLPRVHVAFMGMERVVAALEDLDMLLRLMCGGAAGQHMATYISHITGPAGANGDDGPREVHLIIVDNGRSRILADAELREILGCIRCGACLNVCPVYRHIGGHAYGFAYCGPVGAVVTPLLTGIRQARDLCQGETLCGACREICPVAIDIPRMLTNLRAKLAEGDPAWGVAAEPAWKKLVMHIWAWCLGSRRRYERLMRTAVFGSRLLSPRGRMIRRLPPPLAGWTRFRDLPPPAHRSFLERRRNQSP